MKSAEGRDVAVDAAGIPDPHYMQQGFCYRFDWGEDGLRSVGSEADIVIIVDILRFTSAVSAAVEGGSVVLPYPWLRDDLGTYAASKQAVAAGLREDGGLSLSPTDLLTMPSRTRLVLPSPNGGALASGAGWRGAGRARGVFFRTAPGPPEPARRSVGRGGVIAVI